MPPATSQPRPQHLEHDFASIYLAGHLQSTPVNTTDFFAHSSWLFEPLRADEEEELSRRFLVRLFSAPTAAANLID